MRGFKRVHNQREKAKILNLLTIAAWLISACSHPCPFCLCPRDRVLAPCVLAPCVYMQRQRQETSIQAIEGKDAKKHMKRHKVDKHDRHGKQRSKKASKLVRRQTSKKQTKDGVREGQMQVWIGCPLLHCVEVWTTHQQARLMHGHISKRVKMHIKPTGGINKHGKHNMAQNGRGERYA